MGYPSGICLELADSRSAADRTDGRTSEDDLPIEGGEEPTTPIALLVAIIELYVIAREKVRLREMGEQSGIWIGLQGRWAPFS